MSDTILTPHPGDERTLRVCPSCSGTYLGESHVGCPSRSPSSAPTVTPSQSRLDDLPPEAQAVAKDATRELNQYLLVKLVGKGGMGEVWKAWDRKLSRWVAIKFLLGESEEGVLRFKREAKLAARLSHPNIAPIHEVGEAPSRQPGQPVCHFLAMEFINGSSLGEAKLPVREMVDIFIKVAQGLDAAHRAGIVHRDIKPQNIMLTQERWPYVMDFGLAKSLEGDAGLSATGVVMGTPAFMPPEQVEGRTADIGPESDVYSLGSTMYAVFCGTYPFKAQTTLQLLQKVCNETPPPPRQHNPEIPAELEAVIVKAMSKKKGDRHPAAGAVAEDLKRVLGRLETRVLPTPAPAPPVVQPRASFAGSLLTIAALLLIAAGIGIGTWIYFTRSSETPAALAVTPLSKLDPKPEPKTEPKPDPKVALNSELKPEPKTEPKPEPKPEPKLVVKPEPRQPPSGFLETKGPGVPHLLFILDASGAMRQETDGRERLDAAKELVAQIVERVPQGTFVGVRVFGALKTAVEPGADVDTFPIVAPAAINGRQVRAQLEQLKVKGKAPLTLSLTEACKDAERFPEGELLAILMIDGRETDRKSNPILAAADLAALRRSTKVHVVGFNDDDGEIQERLKKMAEAGGGRLFPFRTLAATQAELLEAVVPDTVYTLLDAEGKEVVRGKVGERRELPQGNYTVVSGASRLPITILPGETARVLVAKGKVILSK